MTPNNEMAKPKKTISQQRKHRGESGVIGEGLCIGVGSRGRGRGHLEFSTIPHTEINQKRETFLVHFLHFFETAREDKLPLLADTWLYNMAISSSVGSERRERTSTLFIGALIIIIVVVVIVLFFL